MIFVFSGVLKNNNFETKMIIADIVFILVWILYLIIKVAVIIHIEEEKGESISEKKN